MNGNARFKSGWVKKTASVGMALALTLPTLAACGPQKGAEDNTERVLRIATFYYGPDDDYFRQQFTELFEFANPNIKVEVVPAINNERYRYGMPQNEEKPEDPLEEMKKLLTGDNPPDVVMMDLPQMSELISENMLTQLDPLITKSKFDTSDIVPAVIEGIKEMGDGKLYALAPTFYSSVLLYNKKPFLDAGVDFPKDGMTWDEIFELARRVATGEGEDRVYGFSFTPYAYGGPDNLFYEMNVYTAPLQLKMFDDNGEKMTVDSDQWERVWKTIIDLYNEKIFPEPIDFGKMRPGEVTGPVRAKPFQYNNFLSGRVAMTIANTYDINELINANKNAATIEGFTPIDWDIVTVPVHPEADGVGGNVYLNGLMGINAKAQNPDDAWKFIQFINSEDWARLKSRSVNQLVSRAKYIQPREGLSYNVKAFYQLKPIPLTDDMSRLYREKPNISQVQYMGVEYFKQAMEGKLEVREALKQWQTAGDAALQQIKENPNAPIDIGPKPLSVEFQAVN